MVVAVTEARERALVVGPATAHLDPQPQHDLAAKQPLDVDTRFLTHAFQPVATLPDHDGLLALLLDQDHRTDMGAALALAVFLDHHRVGVGQLGAELTHEFLAHDLGDQKALAAVGELIRRKEMRCLGQRGRDLLLECLEVVSAQGRHRQHGLEQVHLAQTGNLGQQLCLVLQAIDLVQQK